MTDRYELQRFVDAQQNCYEGVVAELRRGRKKGHWIWYIFPQVAGLGFSGMSKRYAIASIEEAQAYASHPVLGPRLVECVRLMQAVEDRSASQVLGHIDAIKFRSCLTLFALACETETVFQDALNQYFSGERDPLTLQALCVKSG